MAAVQGTVPVGYGFWTLTVDEFVRVGLDRHRWDRAVDVNLMAPQLPHRTVKIRVVTPLN
jgi:hypothetical protein